RGGALGGHGMEHERRGAGAVAAPPRSRTVAAAAARAGPGCAHPARPGPRAPAGLDDRRPREPRPTGGGRHGPGAPAAHARAARTVTGPEPEQLRARAAWSRLAEPGDVVAGALVGALGAADALVWLREAVAGGDVALPAVPVSRSAAARLGAAVRRWAPRLADLDPARDVAALERRGGHLVVPGHPAWPARLDDLGPEAPHALWV